MKGSVRAGRLAGKTAVVTGGASGIGRATVEHFLDEGARVLAGDVDTTGLDRLAAEIDGHADHLATVTADVGDEPAVEAMMQTCEDTLGPIDVVVANAGVFLNATVLDVTPDAWDQVMATDARGTFLTCKHAIARMRGRGGSIVCVSSISGVAGQARQAAYGPAKFVASGLAMHLAVEWASEGIRVNAVAPGTIDTEGLKTVPEDQRRRLAAAHPMGRFGKPIEVARALAFLASDDASFITGTILPVDGGYLAQ
jgi:NAD(P)-dependent dehydrogenase (short-subunit alcohol dehydrogenase family)